MHHHRVAALLIVTNINVEASADLLVHVRLTYQACYRSSQYAETPADYNIMREQLHKENQLCD